MSRTPTVGSWIKAGFLATGLVFLASALLTYLNVRRVANNEALVIHTLEVLDALQDAEGALSEAESGQRGYFITGEKPYLSPYRNALSAIERHFDRLLKLTTDHPAQQNRIRSFQMKAQIRLDSLQTVIDTYDQDGREVARQVLRSGPGKAQMDAARAAAADIARIETDLLAQRQIESQQSYGVALSTILITTVLGIGSIGTAYGLTALEVKNRHLAAEQLARANSELEQRIAERTADLAELNQSLRRSNRELEQFASVASHDLQEPLRKIQAFGDRLQGKFSEALGEQGRDYVERMQASATRMRSLIDALLNYSRITTKALPFLTVDLNEVARDVVSDLEGRLQQSTGHIEVGALPSIQADPLQMRQLLQNILGNGLKFHKPGVPPRVRVDGEVVANPQNGHTPWCRLTVQDNGIGFEPQYQDRIFEVFQRLHGRQEYEGTGIGLAICRRIVERHGGRIEVTSAPDQGACFVIHLPVRQPEAPRDEKIR